jgi:hypothetical protein
MFLVLVTPKAYIGFELNDRFWRKADIGLIGAE